MYKLFVDWSTETESSTCCFIGSLEALKAKGLWSSLPAVVMHAVFSIMTCLLKWKVVMYQQGSFWLCTQQITLHCNKYNCSGLFVWLTGISHICFSGIGTIPGASEVTLEITGEINLYQQLDEIMCTPLRPCSYKNILPEIIGLQTFKLHLHNLQKNQHPQDKQT